MADSTVKVNTTAASSTSGDGLCSLAEAVDYSDGNPEPDCFATPRSGTTTIDLPAGKYALGDNLELDFPTNVVGAGAASTDIDGDGVLKVFNIDAAATVSMNGITISGGMTGRIPCTPVVGTPCPPENGDNGGGIDNFGTLTLTGVTVSGNHTAGGATGSYALPTLCLGGCPVVAAPDGGNGGNGAGIYNETGGKLTLNDSTISGNQTGAGSIGGVGFSGSGTDASAGVEGGTGGNGGFGAGIYNDSGATLTIADSTISGNATGAGGVGGAGTAATANNSAGGSSGSSGDGGAAAGIDNQGTMTMTGSTLSGNTTGAGGAGGAPGAGLGTGARGGFGETGSGGSGVGLETGTSATTSLLNSTIVANVAGAEGAGPNPGGPGERAGINNLSFTGTSLIHVTITGNTAGDSAAIGGPGGRPVTETDSIIAANTSTESGAQSCDGDMIDGGHNIAFAASGCPGSTGDPKLGPLANNGGPTQTLAIGPGSSAIDTIPSATCGAGVDQRGMMRPYGAGCDAGAYESAPPALASPAATVTGPDSASVSGAVIPNLTDAKVVVDYGTTAAYGTVTAATDVGAGTSATPFTVALAGLEPNTAYHAKVVVTNTDGTTSSGDLAFTTPVAATASVRKPTVGSDTVMVGLACAANGPGCSGTLKLQSRVTTKGKKVVAVAASGKKKHPKPKRKTKVETVGSGRYTVAAGQTKVVKLTLNARGKRLLKARHRLPTMLTIAGATKLTEKVTFTYKPPRKKKR
jgi:hypothetical protein